MRYIGPNEIAAMAAQVDTAPANVLAFGRELVAFRDQLLMGGGVCDCGYMSQGSGPTAAALVTLIDALTEGVDPTLALAKAMHVDAAVHRAQWQDAEQQRRRREARYDALMAEEEITRKVECPLCGAQPGAKCRTVSEKRLVRTQSHRDRFRTARSLHVLPTRGDA